MSHLGWLESWSFKAPERCEGCRGGGGEDLGLRPAEREHRRRLLVRGEELALVARSGSVGLEVLRRHLAHPRQGALRAPWIGFLGVSCA